MTQGRFVSTSNPLLVTLYGILIEGALLDLLRNNNRLSDSPAESSNRVLTAWAHMGPKAATSFCFPSWNCVVIWLVTTIGILNDSARYFRADACRPRSFCRSGMVWFPNSALAKDAILSIMISTIFSPIMAPWRFCIHDDLSKGLYRVCHKGHTYL